MNTRMVAKCFERLIAGMEMAPAKRDEYWDATVGAFALAVRRIVLGAANRTEMKIINELSLLDTQSSARLHAVQVRIENALNKFGKSLLDYRDKTEDDVQLIVLLDEAKRETEMWKRQAAALKQGGIQLRNQLSDAELKNEYLRQRYDEIPKWIVWMVRKMRRTFANESRMKG